MTKQRKSFLNYFRSAPKGKSKEGLTLFLHVGLPKTGSTAIQRFLFHNRKALKTGYGICYPDNALHWFQHVPFVKSTILSQFPETKFNNAVKEIDGKAWLEELVNSCRGDGSHSVVLSSEFFWASPAMQSPLWFHRDTEENTAYLEEGVKTFRRLFGLFDDVKVIVYLRRQDKWLESFFNQQIKNGFGIPNDEDLLPARIYLLYAKNLELWAKHFGPDNLIVRSFENAASDIVRDFCRIIGVDHDQLPPAKEGAGPVNPRLSPCGLQIMRKAIEKDVGPEMLELLRTVLTETAGTMPKHILKKGRGVFTTDLHSRLLSVYREDNEKLAEMYPWAASYLVDEKRDEEVDDRPCHARPECMEQKTEKLLERLITQYQKS